MPKVALIMGSKSDWPSLKGCVDVLKKFEIEVEVHVASAHRTPETVAAFAANARENGFEVIIAAAGKAAHLAGVIAGPPRRCRSSAFRSNRRSWTGWIRCFPPCRCPLAFRWRRSRSAAAITRPIWRRRCSRSSTQFWPKSCWRTASRWRRRLRQTTDRFRMKCKAEAA